MSYHKTGVILQRCWKICILCSELRPSVSPWEKVVPTVIFCFVSPNSPPEVIFCTHCSCCLPHNPSLPHSVFSAISPIQCLLLSCLSSAKHNYLSSPLFFHFWNSGLISRFILHCSDNREIDQKTYLLFVCAHIVSSRSRKRTKIPLSSQKYKQHTHCSCRRAFHRCRCMFVSTFIQERPKQTNKQKHQQIRSQIIES